MSMSTAEHQRANNSPQQANLTLSNQDGLQYLLGKIDVAVANIYDRRKTSSKYFREELFVAKQKVDGFGNWTLNNNANLEIKAPPPTVQQSNTFNIEPDGQYQIQDYNTTIRYAFKKPLANLKNAERAIKMALRYDGQVELSADILNNMDFFSNNPDCKKKLDTYCVKIVDKFIENNTQSVKISK